MKRLLKTIKYYWLLWQFKAAKKEADQMHQITGKRYWVFRLMDKYHVVNSDEIGALKRANVFKKDLTIIELMNHSAYHTK